MSDDLATIFGKLFPLLFMMMGPIGVIPVFAAVSRTEHREARRVLARQAALYAATAVTLAVVLGATVLVAWGATSSSLMMASGLLLMIAALRSFFASPPGGSMLGSEGKEPLAAALSPLAFPTMASPHAIGVLIIFVAYFPSLSGKAIILAVAFGVLGLNFLAMLNAERFMTHVGITPLRVLGAVFGVLQVALAIEMIISGVSQSKLLTL